MNRTKIPWNLANTICWLAYVAGSPAQKHGGFHPTTIEGAKSALAHIQKLRKQLKRTQHKPEGKG